MKIFKNKNAKIGVVIGLILMMSNMQSFGQSTTGDTVPFQLILVLGFALVVVIVVLMVAILMLRVLKTMVRGQAIRNAEEAGITYVAEPSVWQKLDKKIFTQAVALENEESIVLDHNYDGIKELDNHLPPWWKYMFYLTVVFAVVYILIYHVFGTMPLQAQEYENEMALAEAHKASLVAAGGGSSIDENNVEYSTDETIIANGAKVYAMNCAPCHKANGEGGIGPNLTDEYWVNNGGSIKNIFESVKFGFPSKGMISWEPLLSPQQMSDVSSFVKSINGSNPADAKAPQGELYVEEEPAPAGDSTIVSE